MDNRHVIKKTIRLRQTEAEMLASKAKEAGMSEASYLRFLISQRPKDYPEIRQLLKNLINEVNHIGVNINQVVFGQNAGFYSSEDKNRLISYMKMLNATTKKVVESLGNQ